MRILLIGASGQVGWELHRSLAVLGDVVAPLRAGLDLASADSIAGAVHEARPDLIVNSAAYTAVDKAESEPELAMKINGDAPRILAEEASRRAAALVHYSTDYVFDGSKTGAYREDDAVAPLNVYGRTKLAGEQAVLSSGANHLIFRTSWVYASRGRNFLLTMRKLAGERKELKIVDDQTGAPTPARAIAEATVVALSSCMTRGAIDPDRFKSASGLYHMTAGGSTTWFGFAQAILASLRNPAAILPIPTSGYPLPAQRPRNSVLDNGKLGAQFGLRLPEWRAGLALCLGELDS